MKRIFISIIFVLSMAFALAAEAVYVCVGSFVNIDNAMALATQLENDEEDVCISEFVRSDNQLFYRVLLKTNTEDVDKARDEADASSMQGAFIVVPKAEEKITTISKAKNTEQNVQNIKNELPEIEHATSPVTLKSGAKNIISSIADFAAFAKTVSNDSEDEEQIEDLIDFFEELIDLDELEQNDNAKEIVSVIEGILEKIENFTEDFSENKKASMKFDENISDDLSKIIPGFLLEKCFVKGDANISSKFSDDEDLLEISFDMNTEGEVSYKYNLKKSPFKTFLKEMKGELSFQAMGKGSISEEEGILDTNFNIYLRQETAICNSKGMGGVILIEGTVKCSDSLDPMLIELFEEDEEEFFRELGKALDMNIRFCVYDDEGSLHYFSTFKNLESLLILADEIDL